MRKMHQIWLSEFLDNCKQSNKSPKTLINYEADLKKYIGWFEHHFSALLNLANANTISLYKQFLSEGDSDFKMPQTSHLIRAYSPAKKRRSSWGWIKRIFKRRPKGVRPKSVVEMKTSRLHQRPLSVNSRRRHLSAIKNFYEFLKQKNEDISDLFPSNPVKPKLHGIKLKEEDVNPTVLLRDEDWKKLEDFVYRPNEKLLVQLLYYGGLRLAEVTHLKVEHFNFANQSVKFPRKGGYVHHLFLQNSKQIFDTLDLHLKVRTHDGPFLFSNAKKKAYSTRAMYDRILRIIQRAGCPTRGLTPHSFRKACATNLYKDTKDLLLVRDYLNHTDAKITQTYIEKTRSQDLEF